MLVQSLQNHESLGGGAILAVQGLVKTSVADPDPNPDPNTPDPHVFGLPGSGYGSITQRYGSGSFFN
jgi:hypothetical protein